MALKSRRLSSDALQQIIDDNRPWLPVVIRHSPQAALKALDNGSADGVQQRVAIKYIVEVLGMHDQRSYVPDSERDSAFAEGRRWVASQILRLLTLPLVEPEPNIEREGKHDRP